MKSLHLIPVSCLAAAILSSCSQEGADPTPPAAAVGGNQATGGAPPSTGGAPSGPTGGTATATGGASSTTGGASLGGGGATSTGGVAAGGTAPAGGSAAGGAPAPGGAGGVAPTGGTSPAGGGGTPAAGGTTAGGGGAPAGGGGAGGGGLTAAEIVPDLQNFYWEGTCAGTISVEGHNCPMTGTGSTCPANGVNVEKVIPVKGVSGQTYTINIEVRGVIGTRCYTGGTRASSAALNESGNNNWWYVGGTYANPTGWWNTYELHVSPATGDADTYYFNGSDVMGGNSCEREATYLVNYKASFKAKGGGTLTFKIHDQNCKGQQNCGSNPDGSSACAPRMVDLTGHVATPPANFVQPPTNGMYRPQWMLIGVTSITSP
jgi:hypothetical protein